MSLSALTKTDIPKDWHNSVSERIEFTRNYSDLSTNQGFQFEFFCDRSGNGFRTKFKPSVTSAVSGAMDVANGLFGGLFGSAANLSERVRSVGWQKAQGEAYMDAVIELKPEFVQCPRCSTWVCRKSCWNNKRGLCKNCAPDIGVEMTAAQAARTRDDIWTNAGTSAEDAAMITPKNFKEGLAASCPGCGAPLATNAKFCPECGAKVKSELHCTEGGAKLQPGAKFCAECGTKVTG
jgi:membrane protease subunit (stomatin/prohibitin family)